MKTSLLIHSNSTPSTELAVSSAASTTLGQYISDPAQPAVQRVHVRRRAIRTPHGLAVAAIRAYREHASL